jgi:uncharacterized repeat protein (TIGR03803 family)
LTRGKSGQWTESVLHSFNFSDGTSPYGGRIFDASGNLYGAAYAGGTYGYGTVFELTPQGSGPWNLMVLYNFDVRVAGVR